MKTSEYLYLASLPFFPGFYESTLDSLIDQEIEMEMQDSGRTWEECGKVANYQAAHIAIAKGWMQAFARETGLDMEFSELQSPREYNFTTDRVFVRLTQKALDKLKPFADTQEFEAVLEDMFTSRSGFSSFYPNDKNVGVWLKPVELWDLNQMQALIHAYVEKEVEPDAMKFSMTLLDRPCVYEAAQHVWDAREEKVTD